MRSRLRALPLATLTCGFALLLSAPAAGAGLSQETGVERWRGRSCTAPGCGQRSSAPWSHGLGFGAACLGAVGLSRRRETP